MNKFKALLLSLGCIGMATVAHAAAGTGGLFGGSKGWNYTHMGSSGSVFTGTGEIGSIYLSSGVLASQDWGVGVDTNATVAVPASVLVTDAQRVTPALIFESSATAQMANLTSPTAYGYQLRTTWDVVDGNGNGIRVGKGFYWFPSASSNGEARRAIIKWRQ